ncbi:MAG: hypothetical protein HY904_10140 [Deltaproteobacteria bacterium]|nr:hypothetical protein [Deltaproteobacteria bacterium]
MRTTSGLARLVAALACAACPRAAVTPDAGSAVRADAAVVVVPPAGEEKLTGVVLSPARVWVAQVKATPDPREAEALAGALEKLGHAARVVRVDLGARGIWFRVTLGEWPRKDLLEARAPALVGEPKVRAVLGPVPEGEAPYVAQEAPRSRAVPPRLGAALEALARAEARELDAWLWTGPDGVRAYVGGLKDGSIRVLSPAGEPVETIPAALPECGKAPEADAGVDACRDPARGAAVLLVADVTGDGAPELVAGWGPERQRVVAWLVRGSAGWSPVATVASRETEHEVTTVDCAFRDLDTDADLEWLCSGALMSFFEATSLCNATPVSVAWDLHGGRARRMDERLHHANGVARRSGGAEEIRAFLRGAQDRAPELALLAALAYLADAPDDAEIYRDVVARAEAAGKEGRRGWQLKALAGLVAARAEWRVGLAPRLHDVLPLVVKHARGAGGRGCDESPLLAGAAAQRARTEPRDALTAASRRPDPRALDAAEVAALMMAFEKGSPLADDVAELVSLLEVQRPSLVVEARGLVAARRNAPAAPLTPVAPQGPLPGVTPPPAPKDEEASP